MPDKNSVKRNIQWFFTTLVFVALSFVALSISPQNAQAEEENDWTFEFGFGYIGELAGDNHYNVNHFGGVNMNFAINQKMNDWVSLLAFEGSMRVIIEATDNLCVSEISPSGRVIHQEYCDSEFLGGSIFFAPRFYFLSTPKTDVFAKLGAGLIIASYNGRLFDLGLRFGLGANFWLTDLFGLGLSADYDLAVMGTRDAVDKWGAGRHVGYVDLLFQIAFRW